MQTTTTEVRCDKCNTGAYDNNTVVYENTTFNDINIDSVNSRTCVTFPYCGRGRAGRTPFHRPRHDAQMGI